MTKGGKTSDPNKTNLTVAYSVTNFAFAFGFGFMFDLGIITDTYGGARMYLTLGTVQGIGASAGM